jgi:hypothetical protein
MHLCCLPFFTNSPALCWASGEQDPREENKPFLKPLSLLRASCMTGGTLGIKEGWFPGHWLAGSENFVPLHGRGEEQEATTHFADGHTKAQNCS